MYEICVKQGRKVIARVGPFNTQKQALAEAQTLADARTFAGKVYVQKVKKCDCTGRKKNPSSGYFASERASYRPPVSSTRRVSTKLLGAGESRRARSGRRGGCRDGGGRFVPVPACVPQLAEAHADAQNETRTFAVNGKNRRFTREVIVEATEADVSKRGTFGEGRVRKQPKTVKAELEKIRKAGHYARAVYVAQLSPDLMPAEGQGVYLVYKGPKMATRKKAASAPKPARQTAARKRTRKKRVTSGKGRATSQIALF